MSRLVLCDDQALVRSGLRMILGEATVTTHVNRIFAKLGVRDRRQAVIVAYESGLVRPGG